MTLKNAFSSNNIQINGETREFITNFVDSFVKWDLLVFFYHNPNAVDNPNNIASRLGRKEEEVKEALEELKKKGLLSTKGESIYAFETSEENKKMIEKFTKLLKDRNSRLEVLSLVLKQIKKGK